MRARRANRLTVRARASRAAHLTTHVRARRATHLTTRADDPVRDTSSLHSAGRASTVGRAWAPRTLRTASAAILALLVLVLAPVLVALGGEAPLTAAAAAAPADATVAYRAPVPGAVRLLRPFVAPPQPWSPGHRGIDLALDEGGTVLAPATGRVTVAGTVVDRGVVTITHPDGRRSSLEPVDPSVVVGQLVAAGDPVGTLTGERSHCAPACLHWGVREGTTYVDPLALLPGGGPIVLLPG